MLDQTTPLLMSKTYSLRLARHPGPLAKGLIVDTGRPCLTTPVPGIIVAHDILEHTVDAHPNPFIDELMAQGGVASGRIEAGWRTCYGIPVRLAGGIEFVINSNKGRDMERCKARLDDPLVTEMIRSEVMKAAQNAKYGCDINTVIAWVVKGYQAHKRRFQRLDNHGVSNVLFNKIVGCCDYFILNHFEEGVTHHLHVDFKRYDAFII